MPAKAAARGSDEARARYDELVARFVQRPDVEQKGKGFGGSALKVGGSMFATLSPRGRLVVKLPRERVESLMNSGDGQPLETRSGRVMHEWVELSPDSRLDWVLLVEEARSFVQRSASRR